MRHPLKSNLSVVKRSTENMRVAPVAPQWPTYTGVSQFVGVSPRGSVTVFVDPSLGAPAMQNAHDLINDADRVVEANDAIFGKPGQPVNIIVFALGGATDGTGGADHNGCDYVSGSAIEVCASFGNSARVSALFEAELSECSMGGNLCGVSTGEALSRWCAAVVGSNALSDFATAPQWAQDGMPDFVTQTDGTDQNADSTGCGMAFLSWLMSQGHTLGAIAQAMTQLGEAGTLSQLYANINGDTANNAWPHFLAAAHALPQFVNDDPFAGTGAPAQLAHVTPLAAEIAGKVFASILADLTANREPHQIVAGVRAAMAASASPAAAHSAGACVVRSRRLASPAFVARA